MVCGLSESQVVKESQSVVPSTDDEPQQEAQATSSVKSSNPATKRKAKKAVVSDEVRALKQLFDSSSDLPAGTGRCGISRAPQEASEDRACSGGGPNERHPQSGSRS